MTHQDWLYLAPLLIGLLWAVGTLTYVAVDVYRHRGDRS